MPSAFATYQICLTHCSKLSDTDQQAKLLVAGIGMRGLQHSLCLLSFRLRCRAWGSYPICSILVANRGAELNTQCLGLAKQVIVKGSERPQVPAASCSTRRRRLETRLYRQFWSRGKAWLFFWERGGGGWRVVSVL